MENNEFYKEYLEIINYRKEKFINGKINKSICRIKIKDESFKTGFFCTFKFPDIFNLIYLLITDSNFSEEKENLKEIEFTLNKSDKIYKINIEDSEDPENSRIFYLNKDLDITIVEIKEKEILNEVSFLQISDFAFQDNFDFSYPQEYLLKINLMYFPKHEKNAKKSIGKILLIEEKEEEEEEEEGKEEEKEKDKKGGKEKEEDDDKFNYEVEEAAPGCPILNYKNFVLGIYNRINNEYVNKSFLLKLKLEEILQEIIKTKNINQKKINNNNIIKLNDSKDSVDEIKIKYTPEFKDSEQDDEINNINCQKEFEESFHIFKFFGEKFVEENKNKCKIIIKGKEYELKSYFGDKIYEIFETRKEMEITLKGINNITDLSHMFCGCTSLNSITNFEKLKTNNITNISGLFAYCKQLKFIPDISKWNTDKINNMSGLFSHCESLENSPDISKWNLKNVKNISGMFSFCSSLKSLPDISKWDTSNIIYMNNKINILYYI